MVIFYFGIAKMHNEEQLLTNFNFILGLKNAGFSMRQIAEDVNHKFNYNLESRQLRYFIYNTDFHGN